MDNIEFRNDLSKLLKKYNVELSSQHDEDLFFTDKDGNCHPLNVNTGYGYAGYHNIGAEEKPKRERKRKPKNPLRRWIYEYDRYNPQLGCSVRKDEVYAKTRKEAEKTAKRHCDSYTAYGSLSFKSLIQVSEPIIVDQDVILQNKYYSEFGKSYDEYKDKYPLMHSDGWDKLHDITEAD